MAVTAPGAYQWSCRTKKEGIMYPRTPPATRSRMPTRPYQGFTSRMGSDFRASLTMSMILVRRMNRAAMRNSAAMTNTEKARA